MIIGNMLKQDFILYHQSSNSNKMVMIIKIWQHKMYSCIINLIKIMIIISMLVLEGRIIIKENIN
jgi:hypothetical protein